MKRNPHDIDADQLVFLGTCADRELSKIAEMPGRKFSYKRCCKLVKKAFPELYNEIAMEFYNPWERNTNLIKHNGKRYLRFVHSQIDYVFYINDGKFKIYKNYD